MKVRARPPLKRLGPFCARECEVISVVNSRGIECQSVGIRVLLANTVLGVIKGLVGFFGQSSALIADAIHTWSDSLTTLMVIVGLRVASAPPDGHHPYGHSRAETVATKLLSVVLILVSLNMLWGAARSLAAYEYQNPSSLALYVALASIAAKEIMYRYSAAKGKRLKSPSLIADAWHHRSDALSSLVAAVGIGLSRRGFLIFDPIAAAVVSVLILRVGVKLFMVAVDDIMDAQVEPEIIKTVAEAGRRTERISSLDSIRVHRYGAEFHVDLTVRVRGSLSLNESHSLVHEVEDRIVKALPSASHVDVHLEPEKAEAGT